MVKQSATPGHYKSQVNSKKQKMDTLFSSFLGAITSTPPLPESSLSSDWSASGEDIGSKTAVQDCPRKRTAINLSYSGSGPDMFGLVSSILEEPSKPEPVTDWLFPVTWAPDFGSHGESSGLSSKHSVERKDFSELVGTQSYSQEHLQKPHDVEMLHRGLEDLHLMESWLSPSGPRPQPVNTLKNSCAENVSSQDQSTVHPEGFVFQNSGCNPLLGSYDHMRLNGDYEKIGSNWSPFSAPNRMKEGTSIQKEWWEPERARGKALKNTAQEQAKYSPACASQPVDGSWDKASQDNHLFSERYKNFTTAHKLQSSLPPSLYLFSQAPKENNFSGGTDRKPQETHVQTSPPSFASGGASNDEYHIQMSPNECSPEVSEYDSAVKKLMPNGSYSSCRGHTWLEGPVADPAAVSGVVCGKGVGTSSQSSSGVSVTSGGSPTHPYYPQISPLLPPRKDGRLHRPNGVSHNLGVSNFITENGKLMKPVGQSQHDPLTQEGQYHQLPMNFSSDWLTQQNAVSEDLEKHHRFPKKQTQETSNKDNRRGRRNWIPHFGCATPNHQQFSVLQKTHKQSGGTVADFINPSFLPSFPLMSDFKQNPSFPPFNPPLFSSPNHFGFPPSPFLFSELVDLFRSDDFSPLNPFTQDLFCGEIAAPRFAFPAPFQARPPRSRSGPANELHVRLEECYEQWRALEKERKKTEADLARSFPGRRLCSSRGSPVPQLPPHPSRVDRLLVEQLRERDRVLTLIGKMERLRGSPVHRNIGTTLQHLLEAIRVTQARRQEEMGNAADPPRPGAPRCSKEKDVLALAAALGELAAATRRARTALWCALQTTLPKTSSSSSGKREAVERALQELCPPDTTVQENSSTERDSEGCRGEKPEELVRSLK